MPVLEGIKCPVCGNAFQDGEDVVFCPDCGTPHHRKCYKLAGHCVNSGLHKSGFVFDSSAAKATQPPAPKQDEKPAAEGFFAPPQTENNEREGEANANPFFGAQPQVPDFFAKYEDDTIDGDSAKFYAAAVNSNTRRFMPLFKKFDTKNSKLGWNWGALLFGPYYLLFRKMYSQGIGLLVLQTLVSYLGSYFLNTKAPKFVKAFDALMASKANGTFRTMGFTQADITSLQGAADYQTAIKVVMITVLALGLLRIIAALFADRMYFSVIKNLVKTVSERLEGGEVIPMINFGNAPAELTGEKAKLFYLSRKGGTSLMPALLAYLAISIISTL